GLASDLRESGNALRPDNGSSATRTEATTRLQGGATNLLDLVRGEVPPGGDLIARTIERGHYPIMHRNLDGPGYVDLAPRVDDPFRQRYAEPLFPPRGLIPGAVLKDLQSAKLPAD